MPLVITYPNFIPGTVIRSAETNTNNADITAWANAHELATTGVHGVGAGTIVGTGNNNVFTGLNSFGAMQTVQYGFYASNARLSISAGRLQLVGDNGAVLSPTNPAYFRVPSSTGNGKMDTIAITSPTYVTIDDATTADSYFYNGVAGTPLGTTSGVAWGSQRPFAVYLVTDDVNPCLFISQNPAAITSPASALIGYKDVPPVTSRYDNFFAMTAANVTVTHANRNCWLIGSFRMASKSVLDDWTFFSLNAGEGLGRFKNFGATYFTMPTGQNGASPGSYTHVNAGTAPIYTSNTYSYRIDLNGKVYCNIALSAVGGGTPGAGLNSVILSVPYSQAGLVLENNPTGYFRITNAGSLSTIAFPETEGTGYRLIYQSTIVNGITPLNGNSQNNATRSILGSFYYTWG